MRLRLTPRAVHNLQTIADWMRVRSPLAAQRIASAIRSSLELLTTMPYAGRPQRVEGVRKLVVRRYPYLVYYLVDEPADEIVVLSIRHSSQRREHNDA